MLLIKSPQIWVLMRPITFCLCVLWKACIIWQFWATNRKLTFSWKIPPQGAIPPLNDENCALVRQVSDLILKTEWCPSLLMHMYLSAIMAGYLLGATPFEMLKLHVWCILICSCYHVIISNKHFEVEVEVEVEVISCRSSLNPVTPVQPKKCASELSASGSSDARLQ